VFNIPGVAHFLVEAILSGLSDRAEPGDVHRGRGGGDHFIVDMMYASWIRESSMQTMSAEQIGVLSAGQTTRCLLRKLNIGGR